VSRHTRVSISTPTKIFSRLTNDSLLQLAQQRIHVLLSRQPNHDLELLDLDVGRVVVLAEEDAHLVLEDVGSVLEEEIDISEGDPLNLRSGGDHGDWGRVVRDGEEENKGRRRKA
jgi:hypothetical protein